MDDALGYSGRRCIVTGAASGVGEATTRLLVDLGAEVHTVDTRKPEITGIASYSETDLTDQTAIARTIKAIGAIVNGLFNCAGPADDATPVDVLLVSFGAMRAVTELVIPLMIDGAVVSSVVADVRESASPDESSVAGLLATADQHDVRAWCARNPEALADAPGYAAAAVAAYAAARAAALVADGIRIECLGIGPNDRDAPPAEHARALVTRSAGARGGPGG